LEAVWVSTADSNPSRICKWPHVKHSTTNSHHKTAPNRKLGHKVNSGKIQVAVRRDMNGFDKLADIVAAEARILSLMRCWRRGRAGITSLMLLRG
jgi:hypothetical protein